MPKAIPADTRDAIIREIIDADGSPIGKLLAEKFNVSPQMIAKIRKHLQNQRFKKGDLTPPPPIRLSDRYLKSAVIPALERIRKSVEDSMPRPTRGITLNRDDVLNIVPLISVIDEVLTIRGLK